MSTGQKPQFPAGYSAILGQSSTAPDTPQPEALGIVERLQAIVADGLEAEGLIIVNREALHAHIEAQAAEIARLRAALGQIERSWGVQGSTSATLHAYCVKVAASNLAPQETRL